MADPISIKRKAADLGFDLVGVARAGPAPHARQFADWLERGYAGEMSYMERTAESRADTGVQFPWAKSLLCVAMRYHPPQAAAGAGARESVAGGGTQAKTGGGAQDSESAGDAHAETGEGAKVEGAGLENPAQSSSGRVSCYAWGEDYHAVMGRRLRPLEEHLRRLGAGHGRSYVDTGPVLERDWAASAGLGWIGKNTALINQELGSWLFLGVIITDLELRPDDPSPDHCGTCTECVDACPTGALIAPYLLDSRLCISYLTIEYKDVMPKHLRGAVGNWIFGCDVCQAVCPWNSKKAVIDGDFSRSPFAPRPGLHGLDLKWALANPDSLSKLIEGTALERARGERLMRNLIIASGNSGDPELAGALQPYVITAPSGLAEQVGWALKRLRG
jgi:epoxyqueuosine reductase